MLLFILSVFGKMVQVELRSLAVALALCVAVAIGAVTFLNASKGPVVLDDDFVDPINRS